jgi:hypothetical protein
MKWFRVCGAYNSFVRESAQVFMKSAETGARSCFANHKLPCCKILALWCREATMSPSQIIFNWGRLVVFCPVLPRFAVWKK